MKELDLKEMYVIAKGLNNKRNNAKLFAQKNTEEIKRLLNVIKEEYPDGFWFYSKNFNQTVLFFLNMVTPYYQDLVEKNYKTKNYETLLKVKSLCPIEQIKKSLNEYRRDKYILELDNQNQVLYAIEHQVPIYYLAYQCIEMTNYLEKKSLVEYYRSDEILPYEERVIYYIK